MAYVRINDSSFDLFKPEKEMIDYYANDDMYVVVRVAVGEYVVEAYSYDGSLEVDEIYRSYITARKLFDFIRENYNNTPPHEELQEFIDSLVA